ncbi:MAG: DNA helicase UvrD [Candidatus Omnitrophica bacterium]|nr:DNA helicase UvrD [Candidatus Omnitrophota bacterium]
MPKFIADFHIHSRYSRACSKSLTIQELAKWAKIKGIGVLGTGDFTHPLWLQDIKDAARDTGHGLFECQGTQFILTAEVNTLFYKHGKAHQIHHVLLAPSLEAVERINRELEAFGDLSLDGRPMLRMEAWRLVEIVLGVEPRCLVVPAHVWTPWFALFGSTSGFDAIEECFEQQTGNIFALETGLSSDPAMNWRLSALDRYTLLSNSDSHSARRIGREANLFECEQDYETIVGAIKTKDRAKLRGTLEFFPEEGKYHYDGHRACGVRWSPEDTKRHGLRCTGCGKKVTVGVMHRVDALADRAEGFAPPNAIPFTRVVPLDEIIAEALSVGVGTQAVERDYQQLIYKCGTELDVLLTVPEETLRKAATERVVEGILRMRQGRLVVEPGYDGVYGTVRLFDEEQPAQPEEQQLTLF